MAKKTNPPVTSDELEIIDADAIVTIKMSTSYYQRIQKVYTTLIAERSHAELQIAYEKINDKKVDEPWIYNLETLGILIAEFQKNAVAEKKTKKISQEEYKNMISQIKD